MNEGSNKIQTAPEHLSDLESRLADVSLESDEQSVGEYMFAIGRASASDTAPAKFNWKSHFLTGAVAAAFGVLVSYGSFADRTQSEMSNVAMEKSHDVDDGQTESLSVAYGSEATTENSFEHIRSRSILWQQTELARKRDFAMFATKDSDQQDVENEIEFGHHFKRHNFRLRTTGDGT